jgi:hypothetical protein
MTVDPATSKHRASHAQYPPESRLRIPLQHARHSARGRRPVPDIGLLLSPVVAAAAISLSSVSVIAKALDKALI